MVDYIEHETGFYFHPETPETVKQKLAEFYYTNRRLRLFYGDNETGVSWNDEFDIIGTIGRSTGRVKIPLIIANARSSGGTGILDHCIVAIFDVKTRRAVYKHPTFSAGTWQQCAPVSDGYLSAASLNGALHAQFKTKTGAARYIQFMTGERFAK